MPDLSEMQWKLIATRDATNAAEAAAAILALGDEHIDVSIGGDPADPRIVDQVQQAKTAAVALCEGQDYTAGGIMVHLTGCVGVAYRGTDLPMNLISASVAMCRRCIDEDPVDPSLRAD